MSRNYGVKVMGFIFAFLLLLGLRAAFAALPVQPPQISLQGKLNKPDGSALQGNRTWRVTFYDRATTGTQLGAATTGTLTLSPSGRFSIALIPPPQIIDKLAVFYELAVDSAATPDAAIDAIDVFPTRVRVNSVPFALNTALLGGIPASQYAVRDNLDDLYNGPYFWKLGGNDITSGTQQFIGPLGNQPFEVHVFGARAMQLTSETGGYAGNVVLGHSTNSANPGVRSGTIGGGGAFALPNKVTSNYATVGGGVNNSAGNTATVGGGGGNTASGPYSVIGGGSSNLSTFTGTTVAGGQNNQASASFAVVGGGNFNIASGHESTLAGGAFNAASGDDSVVGGGAGNTATSLYSSVGGGGSNSAPGQFSVVAGGYSNVTSGTAAMVPGGYSSSAKGDYSLAAGRRAKANHNGTLVWADSTNVDFASSAVNQFLIRAAGGVGINKNNPAAGALDVNGDIKFSGALTGKAVRSEVATGQRIISGIIETNGVTINGSGFTSVRNSAGNYSITFTNPFTARPVFLATPVTNVLIATDPGSSSSVANIKFSTPAGTATDTRFLFFVIGE